jgi:hypothetical protein
MAMLEVNWNPGRKELRQFAGLWLLFFGGIAAWLYTRHGAGSWPTGLAALSLVGIPGLAFPAMMKPIYVAWMTAAFPIGWTISHVLLGIIFYGLVTPLGVLMRLLGRDPMNRRFEPETESYWSDHERSDTSRYFRTY